MHPFARQLLSWQADNPERRVAALVLEVKGDFCHDIRRMLTELGRADDYIELSLDGRLTWNPLSATWLDSYSLAYTVASLLNQLFGKGKEPFWQQACNETSRQSGINSLSAQAAGGRGSVGASKSFNEHREAVFQPRDFALLGNCQPICLPYDGVQSLPHRRVYLKPHYLPADLPYWHAKRTGQL